MKRFFLLVIFCLCSIVNVIAWNSSIGRDKAWQIVKRQILDGDSTKNICVWQSDTIVAAASPIHTMFDGFKTSPNYDAWLFFIDDFPLESWEHKCRFAFVDVLQGNCQIINESRPPLFDGMSIVYENYKVPLAGKKFSLKKSIGTHTVHDVFKKSDNNYAVIISGGNSPSYNWERYWNDCSAVYSTLVNEYGYKKDNISLLIADGDNPAFDRHCMFPNHYDSSPLDLDFDGIDDLHYAATRSNLFSVFDSLSLKLTENDDLFIFVIDHGLQIDGQHVAMALWNNEVLHDYEFASLIDGLNVGNVNICMGQCHSGGFIDNLSVSNMTIATACSYNESSYAMDNYLYDEFVYWWVTGVTGYTPDGITYNADADNNGIVSMKEAFLFASQHDSQSENPQYLSMPYQYGNLWSLYYVCSCYFSLSGPSRFFDTAIYSVSNLTRISTSVTWSLSGTNASCFTLESDTPSTNQCRITRRSDAVFYDDAHLTLTAQISHDGTVIRTVSKELTVPFIDGPEVPCGMVYYFVNGIQNNETVEWIASGTGLDFYTDPLGRIPPEPMAYVINNDGTGTLNGTLTATIKRDGTVVGTLSRKIDESGNFHGMWYQEPTATDTLNSCPKTFHNRQWLSIVPNRKVYLQSDYFATADITYTADEFIVFDWDNSNGIISFTPILLAAGSPWAGVNIQGTYPGSCRNFTLRVYQERQLEPLNPLHLSIVSGDVCEFSLAEEEQSTISSEGMERWQLTIVNNVGSNVYHTTVSDSKVQVNTSGWKPGIYVAFVRIGDQYYSKKFSVGE